jgi:adenylosuccinate lyase
LTKIEASPARLDADIGEAWEVLGEAVQTVLRAAGVPNGYEKLKEFTRGQAITAQALVTFIDTLPLAASEKTRLKAMRPSDYTGLAAKLAKSI